VTDKKVFVAIDKGINVIISDVNQGKIFEAKAEDDFPSP